MRGRLRLLGGAWYSGRMHVDDDLADQLVELSLEAGRRILEIYGRPDVQVRPKEDRSPLTEADLASEACIAAGLARITPGVPVVSEESTAETDASVYWLVDPLDGTKEFLRRNGEFTTNIALVREGEPTAGFVHAPVLSRTWVGVVGRGAWAIQADGRRQPLKCDDASVRGGPVRAVTSRSHLDPDTSAFLQGLRARGDEVESVPMGSSIKICLVAEGGADVYPRLGPTMHWDTAAAHAVVTAAGGVLVDPEGAPLRYRGPHRRNPSFVVCGAEGRAFWPA